MSTYVKRMGPGKRLEGRKVVIIAANEFEDVELVYPFVRLSEEGAEVVVVPVVKGSHPRPAVRGKPVSGRYGTPIPLEVFGEGVRYAIRELGKVSPGDFDAVVIPGGFSPDRLRTVPEALDFIGEAHKKGKIVAAICHGPHVLISAGLVEGRRVTSYAAVKDDLVNAGAVFVDEPAVRDGNLITARVPDDLPEFCRLIIEALS